MTISLNDDNTIISTGRLFALFEVLQRIMAIFNTVLNNGILSATAQSFRGTVFLVDAGIRLIACVFIG